jgi:hypothetical protein
MSLMESADQGRYVATQETSMGPKHLDLKKQRLKFAHCLPSPVSMA